MEVMKVALRVRSGTKNFFVQTFCGLAVSTHLPPERDLCLKPCETVDDDVCIFMSAWSPKSLARWFRKK